MVNLGLMNQNRRFIALCLCLRQIIVYVSKPADCADWLHSHSQFIVLIGYISKAADCLHFQKQLIELIGYFFKVS